MSQYSAGDEALSSYAADDAAGAGDDNLAMLEKAVPGIPGEDYPIYSEVPESGFSCEGQVDGGKIFMFNTLRVLVTHHADFKPSTH